MTRLAEPYTFALVTWPPLVGLMFSWSADAGWEWRRAALWVWLGAMRLAAYSGGRGVVFGNAVLLMSTQVVLVLQFPVSLHDHPSEAVWELLLGYEATARTVDQGIAVPGSSPPGSCGSGGSTGDNRGRENLLGAEIAGQTVLTAYGRLDRATLKEIQDHYDTRDLLQAADALPTVASDLVGQDGLRDMLLRLHGMVHSVINGAGLVVDVNTETLPELASEVAARLQEAISTLQRLASIIEPLACLQLRI